MHEKNTILFRGSRVAVGGGAVRDLVLDFASKKSRTAGITNFAQ